MEIVIEYVLIDNLVINFLILFLTSKLLTSKAKWWRILISNIFGTVLALVFPLIALPSYLLVMLKLLIGALMVLLCYKIKNVKNFFLHYITFLSITALFGGICFALSYLCFGSLDVVALTSYSKNFPVGVIIAIVSAYTYVIIGVINYIVKKQKTKKFIYLMKIYNKDKCYKIEAYLDSAHNLVDPISKEAVTIINFSTFNKIFKVPMEKLLLKNVYELENAHYIDYKTLKDNNQKMLVFSVDKVEIDVVNKKIEKKNAQIGLSMVDFKQNFNCDALISPALF